MYEHACEICQSTTSGMHILDFVCEIYYRIQVGGLYSLIRQCKILMVKHFICGKLIPLLCNCLFLFDVIQIAYF